MARTGQQREQQREQQRKREREGDRLPLRGPQPSSLRPPSEAWLRRTLAELRRESLLDGERPGRAMRAPTPREAGEAW
jgi:hypothetical protein